MQDSSNELFFEAIETNDILRVKEILAQGIDANVKNHDGHAIHVALRWGSQETVKLLLECGADVKVQDACKYTPLHWAARKGETDIVTLLLAQNADVHAKDIEGKTPLHMARNREIVNLLLMHGADITAQDMFGNMPLHDAAACAIAPFSQTIRPDLIEVVAALLEHGADTSALTNTHTNPLHYAVICADSENWCIPQQNDPNVAIIKLLLSFKANVNIQDKEGWTPLHLAALHNHARMIPLFLEHGADLHAKAHDGQTPLSVAIAQSNLEIVQLFLEAGAEVNIKDKNLMTPLHVAVSFDSFERSKESVRRTAAKIDRLYVLSEMPYDKSFFSMMYGLPEIVALLLEYGADIHAKNNEGKTPSMIALEKGHTDILKLLEK